MSRTSTFPSVMTAIGGIGHDLRDRRAARTARRDLARELAVYRTPAEQLEMHAILDRQSGQDSRQVTEMRQILFELSTAC